MFNNLVFILGCITNLTQAGVFVDKVETKGNNLDVVLNMDSYNDGLKMQKIAISPDMNLLRSGGSIIPVASRNWQLITYNHPSTDSSQKSKTYFVYHNGTETYEEKINLEIVKSDTYKYPVIMEVHYQTTDKVWHNATTHSAEVIID